MLITPRLLCLGFSQHPFMKTSTGGNGLVQVIEGAKKAAAKNNELLE